MSQRTPLAMGTVMYGGAPDPTWVPPNPTVSTFQFPIPQPKNVVVAVQKTKDGMKVKITVDGVPQAEVTVTGESAALAVNL